MVGPTQTPYEDGLFLFDLQLTADFPSSRPMIHYVSYTHEIHPLLSFDGNVCGHLIPWNDFETASGSYIAFFLGKLQGKERRHFFAVNYMCRKNIPLNQSILLT